MQILPTLASLLALSLPCFGNMDAPVKQKTFNNTQIDSPIFSIPKNDLEKKEHKAFFLDHGYLWIKDFFTDEQVNTLEHYADEMNIVSKEILANKLEPKEDELIIVPELNPPTQVCRVEDMLSVYPDLYEFIQNKVTAFISDLLDEPYVLYKDKLNFKWPGGGAFLPHQDFPAYNHLPPKSHVTALIHIDSATLKNGCLHVANNWKKTFSKLNIEKIQDGNFILPYIEGGEKHGSIQIDYANEITWVSIQASPKDLVFISSFVPHYSEPNHSDQSRRLMLFTHNKQSEGDHRQAYYQAKREDPQNPKFHFSTPTKARGK